MRPQGTGVASAGGAGEQRHQAVRQLFPHSGSSHMLVFEPDSCTGMGGGAGRRESWEEGELGERAGRRGNWEEGELGLGRASERPFGRRWRRGSGSHEASEPLL